MMAEGSRWRDEDLDEYEDDGYGYDEYEDEEGGEEEEEEEELEEEDPKLTQEELDYLKLREKLKERIRQKYRKENASGGRGGGSSHKETPTTANAEFGSFFGPSKPVIARRVIEESHSLRETQHITSKTSNSHSVNKRPSIIANGERKIRAPKVVNEVKTKVEALKDMRDYSFLFSDDTDIPSASKDPPSRRTSTHNSFQLPPATKLPSSNPRQLSNGNVLKRPSSSNQQAQLKAGVSRPSVESRSKLSGSVNSRQTSVLKPTTSAHQSVGLRKSPAVSTNRTSSDRNNSSVRLDHSNKQCQDQRRDSHGFPKMMAAPRQLSTSSKPPQSRPQQPSHSSKPQIQSYSSKTQQSGHSSKPQLPVNSSKLQQPGHPSKLQQPGQSSKLQHPGQTLKPTRPGQSSRPQLQGHSTKPQQSGHLLKPQQSKPSKQVSQRGSNVDLLRSKPKKRPIEEPEDDGGGDYRSIIRQMFRYNPNRFHDDDDDDNMEANFDDIMREELRSSRIAQKEDEEQLRLIEEEEKRERMRKLAKKQRMR